MKSKLFLRTLIPFAPVAILTGCVGYNTALFVTKSNVGLDLDAKPPTAEINISRKELVIAPTFEGGKTPPVMASFSANTGNNSLERFFFGVNQTFAGGDAAVTMAKLYDTKTNLADTGDEGLANKARFDSALQLGKKPTNNTKEGWRKFFFGLPEETDIRPFVFGTDTQFGLKVNWSGAGGPYPDAVKVGFNRKELAVAPVTLSNTTVRIPSFLATVEHTANGENTGQTNTLGEKVDVAWMQYFATGESADYLSRQYGVRKAMLERTDPKASVRSEHEAAEEELEKRRKKGVDLATNVATEIDRLKDDQLTAGAQAANDSDLFTDDNVTAFDALEVSKKRSMLKNIAKKRTATDEIQKVSNYLDLLKAIK